MNHLAEETSPYLLQHADNPVDWMPWGQRALELARQQNKPILLSVGYSACHWCHVMAHESFEDRATAELMNALYINIKVDREERPDIDKIYQTAHSMLTQRPGGWPLTLFLDPRDQMPIYAGTYFPKQPRQGLPAFSQILQHIHEIYQNRRGDIDQQSQSIKHALATAAALKPAGSAPLNAMPLDIARNQTEKQFDSHFGGYSSAPKFPHVSILERAMRHWHQTATHGDADSRLLHTALFTIERMSEGGLFDHLGGGFYRYSTDEKWMIPHFEKMLYDNGPLLTINTRAWCISHNYIYKHASRETAQWVMRDMQSPDGGYYSAMDADSEGVEGKYYVWQPDEIEQLVPGVALEMLTMRFGLDRPANFEGSWHLHGWETEDAVAAAFDMDPAACHKTLHRQRDTLLTRRQKRIQPALDDKILTSWNALMVKGMAYAGRQLQQPRYIESAARATDFLASTHWRDSRLLATSRDGKPHLNAYLDDYAYLLDALLELLQCRWHADWMRWALQIADIMLEQFEDKDHGGFFFTSHDHEALIQRSKTFADEAIPSGNAVAALSLQRLGYLTGRTEYLVAAEKTLRCCQSHMTEHAISHSSMLHVLEEHLQPPAIIILKGVEEELENWLAISAGRFLPSTLILPVPRDADLSAYDFLDSKTTSLKCSAWLCEGSQCQPPVNDIDTYSEIIDKLTASIPD